SSRRRHTRWPRDWSSDVCSSDLLFEGDSCSKNFISCTDMFQSSSSGKSFQRARISGFNPSPSFDGWKKFFVYHYSETLLTLSLRSEERRVGKESTSL